MAVLPQEITLDTLESTTYATKVDNFLRFGFFLIFHVISKLYVLTFERSVAKCHHSIPVKWSQYRVASATDPMLVEYDNYRYGKYCSKRQKPESDYLNKIHIFKNILY